MPRWFSGGAFLIPYWKPRTNILAKRKKYEFGDESAYHTKYEYDMLLA